MKKKDEILETLANIEICENLDSNEIKILKEKYDLLSKEYKNNKGDARVNWKYTFPGCGERKGKEDPTGDFIIFHEILKYMNEKRM